MTIHSVSTMRYIFLFVFKGFCIINNQSDNRSINRYSSALPTATSTAINRYEYRYQPLRFIDQPLRGSGIIRIQIRGFLTRALSTAVLG
jgi:hypothetical protein